MAEPAPRPNSVRLGSYELLAELATGGMATVYVARQAGATIDRLVVVKRVHPHLLRTARFRGMFQDEARVASLVHHPNVVHLLDVAEVAGELLLVLEYVESVSLATLLARTRESGSRLPVGVAVRIVSEVLAGLHAAHEARDVRGKSLEVVHRDVSPQNVIVGVDGSSRLIDFGIAKAAARSVETTTGGLLKGKLSYMSPEQARGAEVDRRSDVFSAGIVLYESLTGRRLFQTEGSDNSHVLLNVLIEPIAPPSSVAEGLPAALDAVAERALERVRDERYQTALEFNEALLHAVAPASAREVAETLERLCGAAIAKRRTELRRILDGVEEPRVSLVPHEVVPRLDDETEASGVHVQTDPPSIQSVTEVAAGRRPRSVRGLAYAAVLAAASLGIAAAVIGTRRREGPAERTHSPQQLSDASPVSVTSVAPAPAEVGAQEQASAAAEAPPVTNRPPVRRATHRAATLQVETSPSATPAPSASPPPDLHTENPY